MDHCDVLVVGGGPAGSSLAWSLRNSDLDTMIIDRSQFPRTKVCAGWITPSVIDTLEIDINDYSNKHIIQPVNGFRISLMGTEQVEIRYPGEPVSYGIRRCEFDHYLLERSNAIIKQGISINDIHRDGQKWLVNNDIQTSLIVGAVGHFCPVARYINSGRKNLDEKIVAQEIEVECADEELSECNIDRTMPELYFCEDLKGYGWIFPKGNFLNIGLGREDTKQLSDHVQKFCDFLKRNKKIPERLPIKFNGHAYQLYQHTPRQIMDNALLLVGDAAGLAYTQSGEGICPAIESGMIAARVIEEAKGDYSKQQLEKYQQLIKQRFGNRHVNNKYLKMPIWFKKFMANKLLKTKWFARHIVLDKWFLHAKTQPLIIY